MSMMLAGPMSLGRLLDPADHPGTITSGTYPIMPQAHASAQAVQAINRYFCMPWMADFSGPIVSIGVSVVTGGTVTATMKAALVAPNLTTMQPTGLALSSNNAGVSVAGTGVVVATLSSSVLVVRGQLYFVVGVFTWDTSAPTIVVQVNSNHSGAVILGTGLGAAATSATQGWRFDGTYSNNIAAIDFGAQSYTAVSSTNAPLFQVGV